MGVVTHKTQSLYSFYRRADTFQISREGNRKYTHGCAQLVFRNHPRHVVTFFFLSVQRAGLNILRSIGLNHSSKFLCVPRASNPLPYPREAEVIATIYWIKTLPRINQQTTPCVSGVNLNPTIHEQYFVIENVNGSNVAVRRQLITIMQNVINRVIVFNRRGQT